MLMNTRARQSQRDSSGQSGMFFLPIKVAGMLQTKGTWGNCLAWRWLLVSPALWHVTLRVWGYPGWGGMEGREGAWGGKVPQRAAKL